MDRTEYIEAIKNELGFLPENERNRAAEYFDSYFTGAESAEAVISCLGDAGTAAKNYYKNLCEPAKTQKFKLPAWTAAALAVLVMPAAVGLACALIITLTVLVSAAMIVFAAIIVASISLWFEGIRTIIISLGMHIILADKLLQLGIGFLMFSAGLILTWLIAKWYSKMFPWLLKIIVENGGRLLKRRNQE